MCMLQPGTSWQDIQTHLKDGVILCKLANIMHNLCNIIAVAFLSLSMLGLNDICNYVNL